jgi:uncharacterized membrane protein HdeD (DUF308 family)
MKFIDLKSGGLNHSWLIYLFRGGLSLVFAQSMLMWPHLDMAAFGFLFGTYIMLDGSVAIWAGMIGWQAAPIMFGMISLALGSWAFFPDAELALFYMSLIAVWAFLRGLFELFIAVDTQLHVIDDWGLILSGILSVLLSIVIMQIDVDHLQLIIGVMACYAVLMSVLWMGIGVKLRHLHDDHQGRDPR